MKYLLLLMPLCTVAYDGWKQFDAPRPTSADYARRTLSYGRWHDRLMMGITKTVDDNNEMYITLERMAKKEAERAAQCPAVK